MSARALLNVVWGWLGPVERELVVAPDQVAQRREQARVSAIVAAGGEVG